MSGFVVRCAQKDERWTLYERWCVADGDGFHLGHYSQATRFEDRAAADRFIAAQSDILGPGEELRAVEVNPI